MNEEIRRQAITNIRDLFNGMNDADLMTPELDEAIMQVIKHIHSGE